MFWVVWLDALDNFGDFTAYASEGIFYGLGVLRESRCDFVIAVAAEIEGEDLKLEGA